MFIFFVYSVLQPTKISAFLFCLPCDALKMLSCYLESGIWHSFKKKEKPRRGRRNPAHSRVMQTSPKTHSCRYTHLCRAPCSTCSHMRAAGIQFRLLGFSHTDH